jgi:hypothetical protein
MAFACRYLSHTSSKNLTASEAADLAAHGVWSVVVWETTEQRASAGRNAGVADATEAAAQATACGQPTSRPIYFAVDYDAAPSAVVAYFQGVASVLGLSRTGVYGGYRVVSYLLDHKLAAWAWQTVAWSHGQWDVRAHIRQYAKTVRINGVECDVNTAAVTDFGQWMPGKTPIREDDMPTADEIAKAVWAHPMVSPTSRQSHSAETFVRYQDQHFAAVMQRLAAMDAAITTLAGLLGKQVNTEQVVAAVQAAVKDAVIHVDVNVTGGDTPTP